MSTFQIADVRFQISMAIGCNSDIMKDRTKRFAIQAIRFCRSLPCSSESTIVVRQLVRSATSAGANYRAVCRARSGADFISKLGIVLEEADETLFWLELLVESGATRADTAPRCCGKQMNRSLSSLPLCGPQRVSNLQSKIYNLKFQSACLPI